jgi:hypothetical protein
MSKINEVDINNKSVAINANKLSAQMSNKKRADYLKQNEKLDNRIMWSIFLCVGIFIAFMLYCDSKNSDEYDILVQQKYSKWINYKDLNCKVVEHMMGLSMNSGKYTSNDNATVYDCKNGIRYVVSELAENRIKNHQHGDLSFIPDPSKD